MVELGGAEGIGSHKKSKDTTARGGLTDVLPPTALGEDAAGKVASNSYGC